jgi:hypothetical protein
MVAAAIMLCNTMIQSGIFVSGRRDWARTHDPRHVKGDES